MSGFLTISAIVWRQIGRSLSSLGVALGILLLFFWRFQLQSKNFFFFFFLLITLFPLQHLFLQTIFKELAAASIISLAVAQTNQSHHPFLVPCVFFKKYILFIYLFGCGMRDLLSSLEACGIFSCGTWTLSCRVLIPCPEMEPGPPVVRRWRLSQRTTREVPDHTIFNLLLIIGKTFPTKAEIPVS